MTAAPCSSARRPMRKRAAVIIRDLFDAEGGGFFADAELLNRLAREKLQRHADKVAAEGWRWVVAEPELDHEACCRNAPRVCQARAALQDGAQAAAQAASAVRCAVRQVSRTAMCPPRRGAKLARIEAAIEALHKEEYKAQDLPWPVPS